MSQEANDTQEATERAGSDEDQAVVAGGHLTAVPVDADGEKPLDEPGYVIALRLIDNTLGVLEQAVLAGFLILLIGIGVAQAVMIKFDSVLGAWSFELLRYSVFFIAMAGAALSAHTGQLIAMDFVTRALSPTARARMQVVLRLFTMIACVLIVRGGLELADSVRSNPEATIDPKHGLMALPVGAGLMAVHVFLHAVIDASYLVRGLLPPDRGQGSVH